MATREVEKRPLRGALWGLLLGVGVTLLLIAYNVVALGTLPPYVVVVVGILAGIAWGTLGPAKASDEPRSGGPPSEESAEVA